MSETITAMYDNRSDADAAADKLTEAGISRSAIEVMAGSEAGYSAADARAYDHSNDEGGFWARLKSLFMPDESRYSYAEGMNRGSTVLSVTVENGQADMANSILEEYGAVDVQQREAEWRSGGWSGYPDGGIPAAETSAMPTPSGMVTPEPTDPLIPMDEETPPLDRPITERGGAGPTFGSAPSTSDGSNDPVLQAQKRPVDRPASANANGLFGENITETSDPVETPIGSPGARDDAEAGARDMPENAIPEDAIPEDVGRRDAGSPQPSRSAPTETRRNP